MDTLRLNNIHKQYEGAPLLNGVSLDVYSGEILCLLGRSGSGKSTLLRIIAGLERAEQGEVLWNSENLVGTPTHLRKFGLMFQDYALFPHRSVAENVAFGLEMQGLPKASIAAQVAEALKQVNLAGLAQRSVAELSGGEQQRVALARALAAKPRLLMLDEPLAALDRSLRLELQQEISSQLRQAGIPVIYVTHDQEEAVKLGDRMAILHDGNIVQSGTPEQVYEAPASLWVAEFLGFRNFLKGTITAIDPLVVSTALGEFKVAKAQGAGLPPNTAVTLALPVENYSECEFNHPENAIRGVVKACVFRPDGFLITMDCGLEQTFEFTLKDPVSVNSQITLKMDASAIRLLRE